MERSGKELIVNKKSHGSRVMRRESNTKAKDYPRRESVQRTDLKIESGDSRLDKRSMFTAETPVCVRNAQAGGGLRERFRKIRLILCNS